MLNSILLLIGATSAITVQDCPRLSLLRCLQECKKFDRISPPDPMWPEAEFKHMIGTLKNEYQFERRPKVLLDILKEMKSASRTDPGNLMTFVDQRKWSTFITPSCMQGRSRRENNILLKYVLKRYVRDSRLSKLT